jgi:alkaline phosphatase
MNQFPSQGMTNTYAYNAIITDSAASGTALACGKKTLSRVVAMDHSKTRRLETIAEMAKKAGRKVGIVSTVSIDHATPACFYAHKEDRGSYWEIAMQLAGSDFDYFGGGAAKGNKASKRRDRRDVVAAAKENGFTVVTTREELMGLEPGAGKVWAFNHETDKDCALYFEIDRPEDHIDLVEFTAKGIELLDNPDGFFFMIEGGKIDWACHANDAASAIQDTIIFDKAIAKAVDFYEQHPDETVIIVTGDHECGGMTIGYAGTKYDSFPDKLAPQSMSYIGFNDAIAPLKEQRAPFEKVLPYIEAAFGLTDLTAAEQAELEQAWISTVVGEEIRSQDPDVYILYGGYEPIAVKCTHILNRRAGIGWTSYSHTGVPVPTSAMGVGADTFNGYYDNTAIFHKMYAIMTGGKTVAETSETGTVARK